MYYSFLESLYKNIQEFLNRIYDSFACKSAYNYGKLNGSEHDEQNIFFNNQMKR